MPPVVTTTILGIVVGLITYFLIRSYLTPRKVDGVASLITQGKGQSAARIARSLIAKDPRNGDLHYLLGLAYLVEKKLELALMELKNVNQLATFGRFCPEPEFRRKIAVLYERFGQPEEALKEYLLLIRRDAGDADSYYHAGILFEDRGNSDNARSYLRKAVELDPNHADARYRLGVALHNSRAPIEAKVELEAAIRLRPQNYRAHFYLGRLLREAREYIAALLCFEKAEQEPELKVRALVERGACYLSVNNIDKAVMELERAIHLAENESAPEILHARYLLAQCHERTRSLELAIIQWEKIYQRKPGFRDVAEKLSQYQELRTDDRMKDYLTAPAEEFEEICKAIASSMGLHVRDVTPIRDGCQIIAVVDESKWRNTRKLPTLIRFMRVPDVIQESTARALYEEMRKLSIVRAMMITSSSFARKALDFAETRPIDLVGKEKLQELLKKSEQSWVKSST